MMRKLLGVIEIELADFEAPWFWVVLDDQLAGLRADFVEVRRRWDSMSVELRREFTASVMGGTCDAFWRTHAELWPESTKPKSPRPDGHLGAVED